MSDNQNERLGEGLENDGKQMYGSAKNAGSLAKDVGQGAKKANNHLKNKKSSSPFGQGNENRGNGASKGNGGKKANRLSGANKGGVKTTPTKAGAGAKKALGGKGAVKSQAVNKAGKAAIALGKKAIEATGALVAQVGIPVIAVVVIVILVMGMALVSLDSMQQQSNGSGKYGSSNYDRTGLPDIISDEMFKAVMETRDEYDVPASVTFAQIIVESRGKYNGLSYLAYQYYNLFGIKGSGTAGSVNMDTGEHYGGQDVVISAGFRAYYSHTESIIDHAQLLASPLYTSRSGGLDWRTKSGAQAYARAIGGLYATSPVYSESLVREMDTYDLYRFDTMTEQAAKNSGGGTGGASSYADAGPEARKVADLARSNGGTRPCTLNYCAAWVSGIFEAAGQGYIYGNAIDFWNNWSSSGSTSMDNIPVGAVVVGSGYGSAGAIYGHVGIYLGDGMVASNIGYLEIATLEQHLSWQTAVCQGHQGWVGWVWANGKPLN